MQVWLWPFCFQTNLLRVWIKMFWWLGRDFWKLVLVSEVKPNNLWVFIKKRSTEEPNSEYQRITNFRNCKTSTYLDLSSHLNLRNMSNRVKAFHRWYINLSVKPEHLSVGFEVVSLFLMVSNDKSLQLIKEHFENDITSLFQHCLKTTYLQIVKNLSNKWMALQWKSSQSSDH